MFVPSETTWEIDLPQLPEGAEWTKAPVVADRLHYRQDRRGYTETGYTHLFLVPADSGTPRALTSGEWLLGAPFDNQVYEVGWDWSPDGTTIVVDGLDAEDADLRYRDSDIFAIDVASGERRQLTTERGTWASPRISPNGRLVAFAGHPFTKASYQASELYVMSIDGADVRKISGDFDRDAHTLQWAGDGSGVYFTAGNEGTSNVHFGRIDGGVEPVTTGEHMMSLGNISSSGVAVGVRTGAHAPPDVVGLSLGAPGRLTQLTNLNDDLLGRVTLGAVEEIWYDSSDDTRVQGWIVKPPGFDESKRYPLILEIHGGPHGMYNVGFNYMFQAFAAQDFVVLYTNPRGSTGYGSAFGNAIERAYPSVDYDDLMAGVDAVVASGYIDERNMFVGGCSGGGVLSSWVIGHTDRFAAAAVRCPVTNWLSFVGQTDIPLFTRNFFDAPFWEEPEQWLKQSSLMYVGNVTTPTLLMTGILDMRTPMAQTEEYYTALKMRGIPAKLIRFEEEYHGTSSKPSNYMRTLLYMMSWYREHGNRSDASATAARTSRPEPQLAQPTEPVARDLIALERQIEHAVLTADVAFLDRVCADDFTYTHGDGWTTGGAHRGVETKSDWLDSLPGRYSLRDIETYDVELHGDVAMTTGQVRARTGPADAEPRAFSFWYVRVYGRRDGQWRYLSHRTVSGPVYEPCRRDDETECVAIGSRYRRDRSDPDAGPESGRGSTNGAVQGRSTADVHLRSRLHHG